MDIGTKIKRLRLKKGLTGKELGKKSDLHPTYLTRIEKGSINKPRKQTITKILNGLELNEDQRKDFLERYYLNKENNQRKRIFIKETNDDSLKPFESNNDFIQTDGEKIAQNYQERYTQAEEILDHTLNQEVLAKDLELLGQELIDAGNILKNRNTFDLKNDNVRFHISVARDRIEYVKLAYGLYIKKLVNSKYNLDLP